MSIMQDPEFPHDKARKAIMIHYPLDAPIEQLFPATHSNSSQYKAASKSLVRKLKKKGLLKAFDDQMIKSIHEGHAVMLSPEEGRKILQQCHCFSGINYATKMGSSTHKIRLVTNSSSNHPNGSLNSHTPKGINMIGNLKSVFTKFRLKLYAVIFYPARAYISIHSSQQTNQC